MVSTRRLSQVSPRATALGALIAARPPAWLSIVIRQALRRDRLIGASTDDTLRGASPGRSQACAVRITLARRYGNVAPWRHCGEAVLP
jgi:hypothetical protein